jgi:hypothetical protein
MQSFLGSESTENEEALIVDSGLFRHEAKAGALKRCR